VVTFYEDAITPSCHEGLKFLRQHSFIQDFYLAGGTALAVQIGHRVSTDLDWFSHSQSLGKPARDQIREGLVETGDFEVVSEQDGMLFTRLFRTDVSFIHQHHPLLAPTVEYQAVQPMPRMLVQVQWADIRTYCQAAARRLGRHLSGLT
jgi:hypothetical protein